jgi:hypothetical protein
MPTLPELQAGLAGALLREGPAPVAAEIAADGLAAEARLDVYRHHVLTSLTAALATTYPVVERLVGDGFFRYAADRYVRSRPPEGPCLFEYGATFAEFLESFPACAGHPYLPDVARLEWALHTALHAEAATPLGRESLAAVPPADLGRLQLRLDPAASWVRSRWPVDRIWRANQPEADAAATVDLAAGGTLVEVRRRGDAVGFRTLAPAELRFRADLAAGASLERAASAVLAEHPAFDLTSALRALLDEELLVGLALPARRPRRARSSRRKEV